MRASRSGTTIMKTRPSFLGRATHGVKLSPRERERSCNWLFQRRVDIPELSAQAATDAVDRSDNSQRNTGCDQAVFDGSSVGFVSKKPFQNVLHYTSRGVVLDWPNNRQVRYKS